MNLNYIYIYIYIWDKAFEMINVHIGANRNGAHWTFLPTRRVGTDGLTKPRTSHWIIVLDLAVRSSRTKKIRLSTNLRAGPEHDYRMITFC